jgi:DNA mismatch repair ATPase MutS
VALLNVFFGWDARLCHRMRQWLETYRIDWGHKEKQLAQIEVWISGACYLFNFPTYTFATFGESDELIAEHITHPFLLPEKAVSNELKMENFEQLLIVTGPNMAGKSTFLRSIGLLFVCSEAGLPVAAKKCQLPRRKLFTSMRLTDNLNSETSYFFAELLRLKQMMERIENGEPLFVIIDEMLKGTNSLDKEQGSLKFLRKIQSLKTMGIVATHDLALCSLEGKNKGFKNKYFDSVIEGEELHFDYLLKDGQCQNMNAQFLMNKLGLIVN